MNTLTQTYYVNRELLKHLDIVHENINTFTEEAYAIARKNTIGASDMSIILGVGIDKPEDLIAKKQAAGISEAELEIGKKASVRKGKELEEPIIRPKAAKELNLMLTKPEHMYGLKDYPCITINYDAVSFENDILVPVELKYVTTFATKAWTKPDPVEEVELPDNPTQEQLADYIRWQAFQYKIPPYYYTQVQIQIYGMHAPYGYIAALFEKDWEMQIRKIRSNQRLQFYMLQYGVDFYNKHLSNGTIKPPTEAAPFEY